VSLVGALRQHSPSATSREAGGCYNTDKQVTQLLCAHSFSTGLCFEPLKLNITMAGETGVSVSESKFPLLLADGSRFSIQFNNVDRSTPVTQCVVPKPWRAISWIYVYILLVHIALVATSLALLRNHGATRLDDGSFCKLLSHLVKFTP